jgi:hypothetical protein
MIMGVLVKHVEKYAKFLIDIFGFYAKGQPCTPGMVILTEYISTSNSSKPT